MLRAVRFAAKLEFTIDHAAEKAMAKDVPLLANVPAARLFDEFLKLFQAGFAEKTFDLLRKYKLFAELFPMVDKELDEDPAFLEFVRAALKNTDRRVKSGKSVTPMFLIGVFLWNPTRKLAEQRRAEEKMSESQSLSLAAYELGAQQQRRIAIPRRFTVPMREMLSLQPRFMQTRGKRAIKLLQHRCFRAAYDFMLLLAEVGQFDSQKAEFWTKVQTESAQERAGSFEINDQPKSGRRRRRRRRRPKPKQTS